MNKKKIIYIKIILLSIIAIKTLTSKSHYILVETPPLFIYPIITVLLFVFSIAFFMLLAKNNKLTPAKFSNFSFNFFYDPLPFWHFCYLYFLIISTIKIFKNIIYS
jgi:hypothetical protein